MKPFVGITSSMEVDGETYMVSSENVSAITQAGGIPVILPPLLAASDMDQIAQTIDGLYLTGGYDIDPLLFGEEPHQSLGVVTPKRDAFEIALTNKILELGKPILGVCRGAQILNVAVGGDMYQDIYAQMDQEVLQHAQQAPREHGSHYVKISKDSLLHRLIGAERIRVNSRHHQANRKVTTGFQVSGIASDGVVEAIESKLHPFVLGLQWHPESMATANDGHSLKIFQGFIDACQDWKGGLSK